MDRRFLNFKLLKEYFEISRTHEESLQERNFWNQYGDMITTQSNSYHAIEGARKLFGGDKNIHGIKNN
jgi:hypothetical protein